MNQYLIPVDEDFIESIAMAIAKDRLHRETVSLIEKVAGENVAGENVASLTDMVDKSVDSVFEIMWNGITKDDEDNREIFRVDALAAIRSINLKLMSQPQGE